MIIETIEDREIAVFCYGVIDFVVTHRIGFHDIRYKELQQWHKANRYDAPDVARQAKVAFTLLKEWVNVQVQLKNLLVEMQSRLLKSATDLYDVRGDRRDEVMKVASERLLLVYLYLVGAEGHSFMMVKPQVDVVDIPMLQRLSRASGGPIDRLFAFNRRVAQAIVGRCGTASQTE